MPLVRVGAKGVGPGAFRPASWDEAVERVAAGLRGGDRPPRPRVRPAVLLRRHDGLGAGLDDGQPAVRPPGGVAARVPRSARAPPPPRSTRSTAARSASSPSRSPGPASWCSGGRTSLATNLHQWAFVAEAQRRGAHRRRHRPAADRHGRPLRRARRPAARHRRRTGARADARTSATPAPSTTTGSTAHTVGWPELDARLDEWPVGRAAEISGVPGRRHRVARRADRHDPTHRHPRRARPATARRRRSGRAGRDGASPLLTGDFRHPGGGALCSGSDHHRLTKLERPADLPTRLGPHAEHVAAGRGAHGAADPPVTALVVFNANPAATVPDQSRSAPGSAAPTCSPIVLEQRWTDTCDCADVVLPATMQPEHLDLPGRLRPPLRDAEPARDRADRRGVAEHGDLPAAGRRARAADHPRLRDGDEDLARAGAGGQRDRSTHAGSSGVGAGDRHRGRRRPLRQGRLPDPRRAGPPARSGAGRASGSTRWSATRRRPRCSTPSWPGATRWRCCPRRRVLPELHLRLDCRGTSRCRAARACTCIPTTPPPAASPTAPPSGCTTTGARSRRRC